MTRLNLLPEKQGDQPVGFINDAKTFESVWKAFKPGESVPGIDFTTNMVLFTRNIQYYNRISIGKVSVKDGVGGCCHGNHVADVHRRSGRHVTAVVARDG